MHVTQSFLKEKKIITEKKVKEIPETFFTCQEKINKRYFSFKGKMCSILFLKVPVSTYYVAFVFWFKFGIFWGGGQLRNKPFDSLWRIAKYFCTLFQQKTTYFLKKTPFFSTAVLTLLQKCQILRICIKKVVLTPKTYTLHKKNKFFFSKSASRKNKRGSHSEKKKQKFWGRKNFWPMGCPEGQKIVRNKVFTIIKSQHEEFWIWMSQTKKLW